MFRINSAITWRLSLLIICSICLICCYSCKEPISYVRPDVLLTEDSCYLPSDIKTLLSSEDVAEVFKIDKSDIELIPNATDANNLKAFFIWHEDGLSDNRGLFFSIKKSVYQEYGDDYISQVVGNLKTEGETDADGKQIVYLDMPDIGSDGAYSLESNTFVWQVDNCVLFKLVANTDQFKEAKFINAGQKLAVRMLSNYYAFLEL